MYMRNLFSQFIRLALPCAALLMAQAIISASAHSESPQNQALPHFDKKGQPASTHTTSRLKEIAKTLPFDDARDFAEQKRGLLAVPDYRQILAEDGHVVWDMAGYDWLLQEGEHQSIHPSLLRQAVLNMNYGLYEVIPGKVFQVRGFDLANSTFIKGDTGWIVFDVLTSKETAAAALKLVNEHLGARPVVAVVYSHSHGDHFGGIRGMVAESDVADGKVEIIAPLGFMDHTVSENIAAGNAMNRRLHYQYGAFLAKSPYGHVDQAIGKGVSRGTIGLIPPTKIIKGDIEEMVIDGIRIIFQNTPGTEAPAEMNAYFPQWKAFWAAENISATIHNIYTLRGALVRDALEWTKQINKALYMFGKKSEVMFSSHNWPRWGNERIQEVMRAQRDAYAHLNNGVLNLANQGVTVNQVHNQYKVPESLQQQWSVRSYHGSVEHNSRAVIDRYLGWWDGNPVNLIPLSPSESAPLFVEMMGGSKKILRKAKNLYKQGDYRLAQEILNKLVFSEPSNEKAKALLADTFEQIGYQQESSSVRNSFLAAALELRHGIPSASAPSTLGPDMVRAMTTGLWLDYLGIQLDSDKAAGKAFIINFKTPDNGEKFVLELSNGTLTNIAGYEDESADLDLSINRSDLVDSIMGLVSFEEQGKKGNLLMQGDATILPQLLSMMTPFDPKFEILPGTALKN